jgi:aspartyl/asparaginyl beta-hydroxylase (cupin superfamily)
MIAEPVFFLAETDTYDNKDPYFYNKEDYSWVSILENNWHIIKDEMKDIIDGKKSIELSSPNPPYLSNPKAWKNIYFYNFLWKYHDNCKKYPKTYALLRSVPNLTFAEFTVLEGNSKILPHIGETNTTIRGHLGIDIPDKLPKMGICVGEEERGWENGKVVLFSDAHRHHVWNNSDKRRFVLVFDVIKDEYVKNKYWMCAQSLSALTIKYIDEKINLFRRLPKPITLTFHYLFSAMWWLYLPLQRRFS